MDGPRAQVFTVEAVVLPLQCYDMIVGVDWLEDCCPMWVHWTKKIMKFTYSYKGKRVTLHGLKQEITKCPAINARKLKGLLKTGVISHCIQLK